MSTATDELRNPSRRLLSPPDWGRPTIVVDTTSTITLALTHVALVPVVILGLMAIARRSR